MKSLTDIFAYAQPLRPLGAAAVALLIVMAAGMAPACTTPPANDYSEYHHIPAEGWRYGEAMVYRPEFRDSVATGRLVAAVTHAADFPYTSLWLEVSAADPSGRVAADTVRLMLADRYGRWLGRGIGPRLQVTDTLARRVTIARGTPVKVRHIMQTDTLPGIEQVGIFFMADRP